MFSILIEGQTATVFWKWAELTFPGVCWWISIQFSLTQFNLEFIVIYTVYSKAFQNKLISTEFSMRTMRTGAAHWKRTPRPLCHKSILAMSVRQLQDACWPVSQSAWLISNPLLSKLAIKKMRMASSPNPSVVTTWQWKGLCGFLRHGDTQWEALLCY